MAQMVSHRGFNIAYDGLKQTVDDFMERIDPITTPTDGCKRIDAARIAMANAAACSMLIIPHGVRPNGCAVAPLFAPNRIQRKHLTTDSRLRTLMHSGILGVLARKLTLDPTQPRQWNQGNNARCIVRRANNASGCAHVKWSIPEFQCAFNIGIKMYKSRQSPFNGLSDADLLAQFNLLDNPENRDAFLAECRAIAHHANQSRVVQTMEPNANDATMDWKACRPTVVENTWIMNFMDAFIMICSSKMSAVSDISVLKMDRCISLIDLYRFIPRIDWILNDPNVRFVLKLNSFYNAHIQRLFYMADQGIEHSAYMLARICPEMMTPEVHMRVDPKLEFYMVPQLQIQLDDDVFGPMKLACQAFMPEPIPAPPALPRRLCYSNSDSDGYYSDGTDDTSDVYDYTNNDDDGD